MAKKKWYPLDNAANIYPITQHSAWTSMFRWCAVMREEVDVGALTRALKRMKPRFPGYYVKLKRGLFWYYFEQMDIDAVLKPDTLYICPKPDKRGLSFRVTYYHNRIACEFAHYLGDGGGVLVFFKTLLAQYVRELGADVPVEKGILDLNEAPRDEEWADAFRKYARMAARPGRGESSAYHMNGTRLPQGTQVITTGVLSVKAVLEKAHEHHVSLTEYLTALLIFVLYRIQQSERRRKLQPVKVSVPVSLRKYYKTETLRNFSQYLNPGIDPNLGDFTFEETLEQVHHYFRYMFTEKNLNARMSQNVGDETNMGLRIIPLFLKRVGLRIAYEMTGERLFSSVLSNVGTVDMPAVMAGYMERIDLLLSSARRNPLECGVVSYGDVLSITFTRSIAEPHAERMFFRALVHQGLHVCVESNQM